MSEKQPKKLPIIPTALEKVAEKRKDFNEFNLSLEQAREFVEATFLKPENINWVKLPWKLLFISKLIVRVEDVEKLQQLLFDTAKIGIVLAKPGEMLYSNQRQKLELTENDKKHLSELLSPPNGTLPSNLCYVGVIDVHTIYEAFADMPPRESLARKQLNSNLKEDGLAVFEFTPT